MATVSMRVFGYSKRTVSDEGLLEMKEVSIAAAPATLRTLAAFLNAAAEEMEMDPKEFDHEHLQLHWDGWRENDPDFVVVNPTLVK